MLNLGIGLGLTHMRRSSAVPYQFSFTDDFNSGASWMRDRSGWIMDSADFALTNQASVAAGISTFSDGYASAGSVYQDVGRIDGGSIEGVIAASADSWKFGLNLCTERDYIYVEVYQPRNRLQIRKVIAGTSTSIYDTTVLGSPFIAEGGSLKVEYSWSAGTCTVLLFVDGVRYPNAGTSWTVAASGLLQPSGRVGLIKTSKLDSYAASALTAGANIRLNKLHRIYQRHKTTTLGIVPISGVAKDYAALQFRLLQSGTVVSGWDWGDQSIAGLSVNSETGAFTGSISGIPQGNSYTIEIRDSVDNLALTKSRAFDVGAIWITYGQSLALGCFNAPGRTVASDAHAWFPYTNTVSKDNPISFETEREWGGLVSGGNTRQADRSQSAMAAQIRAADASLALGWASGGWGSQSLDRFLSTSSFTPYPDGLTTRTLWQNLTATLDYLGDIEGFIWSQGQNDAGRTYSTSVFLSANETAYKANFAQYIADIRAYLGRTAAQLPVLIVGHGRLYPPSGVIGDYTADASYDRFRKCQYDLTSLVDNCHLSHFQIDLTLAGTTTDEVHLASTDMGYMEDVTRMGAAMARISYGAATDRRGPLPLSAVRDATTIAITYDANGCSAITCAAAVATNVIFWTDATYVTQLTPSSMSIAALSGGQIVVTWTFSATAAGNVVTSGKGGAYSTGGIYPDMVNSLKGTLSDGRSVVTWPVWAPIVLT